METRLLALKGLLDGLGISTQIDTLNDRKRLQKAVYLGQLSGLDLGYRFSWYIRGPYCTELARDYYDLTRNLQVSNIHVMLNERALEKLQKVRPVLDRPDGFPLEDAGWLELVASYHFLRKDLTLNHHDAVTRLQERKAHLAPYVNLAKQRLEQYNLLS